MKKILNEEKKPKIISRKSHEPKKKIRARIAKKKEERPKIIEEGNPIYFKLQHEEAINSKKNLLFSELSFLTILKIMKRHNSWRKEELKIRSEILGKVKELNAYLQKTKAAFPSLTIPKALRKKHIIELKPLEETEKIKESFDGDLESQLRDIQAKLNSIGR